MDLASKKGVVGDLVEYGGNRWLYTKDKVIQSIFRGSEVILGLSFFLLLRARVKFQPSADDVLSVDKRPPILFLRSFSDDDHVKFLQSSQSLFDFSLESRLAGHYSRIGPFIAVAAPGRETDSIGAARAALTDAEWQGQVADWMKSARTIILMAGVSHWIGWELRQIVERGYTGKLIVVFPELRRRGKRKFQWSYLFFAAPSDAPARLEAVRGAFCGTPWEAALAELSKPDRIRCLTFSEDGSVTVICSRASSRDLYHLAALIAEYLQIKKAQGGASDFEDRARKEIADLTAQKLSERRKQAGTIAAAAAIVVAAFAGGVFVFQQWRETQQVERQRDLFTSNAKAGDEQLAKGDIAGALKSYQDFLSNGKLLANSYPSNAKLQFALSVLHQLIGDAQSAKGDFAGALQSYRDGLAMLEPLATPTPATRNGKLL